MKKVFVLLMLGMFAFSVSLLAQLHPPTNLHYQIQDFQDVYLSWTAPLDAGEMEEGFDSEMIPAGWSAIDNNNDGHNWFPYEFDAHSGDMCMASASWWNFEVLNPDNYLISPQIHLGDSSELRFWVAAQDDAYPSEHYKVRLSTTGTSPEDFNTVLHEETLSDNVWKEVELDLSEYAGEKIYLAWHHTDSSDEFIIKIDEVSVKNVSTREVLFFADFTDVSDFAKFAGASRRYEKGRTLSGYAVYRDDTLLSDNVATTSYTDEELADGIYTYFVKAIYSEGESIPSNTVTVEVMKNQRVILHEDFANGTIPNDWDMTTNSGTGWFVTMDGSDDDDGEWWDIPQTNGYYVCSNDNLANDDGSADYLFTPALDLSDYNAATLTFMSFFTAQYGQTAHLDISTDGGLSWKGVDSITNAPTWVHLEYDLSVYAGEGFENVQIRFHSNDNGGWGSGWAVDDIKVVGNLSEGQTRILVGTVTNQSNVKLYNVKIQAGNHITYTDIEGEFEIELPLGIYTFSASHTGYTTWERRIEIEEYTGEDEDEVIDIADIVDIVGSIKLHDLSEYLIPPTNLIAEVIGNQVTLEWNAPETAEGFWINYGSGDIYDAIGTNSPANFDVAIRFEPSQIEAYDGFYLTQVEFVPHEEDCLYSIRVWQGDNGSDLLVDQLVTEDEDLEIDYEEWNTIALETPVQIDASQELWIGYNVNTQGGFPAGIDPGPAVTGYGDMIHIDGIWSSISESFGYSYNWNIAGFVETSTEDRIAVPLANFDAVTDNTPVFNNQFKLGHIAGVGNASMPPRYTLMNFNIYRDGELIGNTATFSDTTFIDTGLSNGEYVYGVSAVYNLGESPIRTIEVEVVDSDILVKGINHVNNYPNPFNPETTIKFQTTTDENVTVEVFNIKGQKVTTLVDEYLPAGTHEVQWSGRNDSNQLVGSGVYFYRLRSGRYTSTKKMILMK